MQEFFNNELKRLYLKETRMGKVDTFHIYERLFIGLKNFEETLKKDFCDFNRDQMVEVLQGLLNEDSYLRKRELSLLKRYVEWCIKKTIKESSDNPLDNISLYHINDAARLKKTSGLIEESFYASIHDYVLPVLLSFAKDGLEGQCNVGGVDYNKTIRELIEKSIFVIKKDKTEAQREFEDYINSFPN